MVVQQTGCASRDVGILIGGIFLALAFFPKLEGVLVAIPGPIVAMYLVTMMALIFVEGMRTVIQDEPDYRKSLLVGVVMAIGLDFHFYSVSLPVSWLGGNAPQRCDGWRNYDSHPDSVLAASDGPTAELEFASAPGDTENLEDWIALLRKPAPEMPGLAVERDISLGLLSHYASSVSHQQYHETEIITVRVAPASTG